MEIVEKGNAEPQVDEYGKPKNEELDCEFPGKRLVRTSGRPGISCKNV